MTKQAPALLWFRGDLRLSDHLALAAAMAAGGKVLPIYILEDEAAGHWRLGGAARWWLHQSLTELATSLEARGARLMLARGDAATLLPALMAETGAETLHAGAAHEGWARAVERTLAETLGDRLHLHRTTTLFDPATIRTKAGGTFGVYTPFAKACRARSDIGSPLPAPKRIPGLAPPRSDQLDSWQLLPTHPDWATEMAATWSPGECHAQARLGTFLDNLAARYKTGRNLPGEDGTSRLSPHLRFGELSPRQVWHASRALNPGEGLETYLNEILWREFSAYLLFHHPDLPDQPLRPAFAKLKHRTSRSDLAAWQRGRTGVPIVDAGMRQLWRLGWMHNRVRMITASFLVKHLLLDWHDGECWFWDTLVDGDLASNSANWQWINGSGTDSQPFFRIFNPVTQGKTWDADGAYVREFVPEIARLPDKYLHAPWTAPDAVLAQAGVVLGKTYPAPIVDLAQARQRALDAYRTTVRQNAA